MTELQDDNLQSIIDNNEIVMVQYGATWCGNCKLTKPKFRRMSDENPEIEFVYVDAEKLPNSRALADVKNLPTFAAFKNGKLVNQYAANKIDIVKDLLNEASSN